MTGTLKVGPISAADNSTISLRGTKEGGLVTHSILGDYGELSRRGDLFVAANVAAKATSVGLTTTYTGLCVSNPAGSGKNLIILGGQYALSVAEVAAASWHLIAGYSSAGVVTHTVSLPSPGIQNCFINGTSGSVALADTECTIVNPFYLMPLRSAFTAGAFGGPGGGGIVDLKGFWTIPPGGWIANGSLTATTGFAGFLWTEVDA